MTNYTKKGLNLSFNVKKEFDKGAKKYEDYNIIQKKVAKYLVSLIDFKPKKILDLGCGSGEIYKNITWQTDQFIAVDFSKNMCELHPKSTNIEVLNLNFNEQKSFEVLKKYSFDLIVSSSSLQWAKDLEWTLSQIKKLSKKSIVSIFTSNTFNDLHQSLNIKSPIVSKEEIFIIAKKLSSAKTITKTYTLHFNSTKELLSYIKNSGVSGGKKIAQIKDIKKIIRQNQLKTISAEVVFISLESSAKNLKLKA